jgi:hypothetical protein
MLTHAACAFHKTGEDHMKAQKICFFMILTGFLLYLVPSTGHAQNRLTPANQLVVLQNVQSPSSPCVNASGTAEDFMRVFPNGVRGTAFFRIPAGKALVVTDFDWFYDDPEGAAAAGRTIVLRLWIANIGNLAGNHPVALSTIILNDEGKGGASEHLASGFAVSSQAMICVDREGAPADAFGPVDIRGYLLGD